MAKTKIEWTETSWNPVTGCSKISPGCQNCYADKMSLRLKAMGQKNYANGFKLTIHRDMLNRPLIWKKPQMIFVNSMSDLFHEDIPDEFISTVFDTMGKVHWHRFQILTKRSSRLIKIAPYLNWFPNIWLGVSVENDDYLHRIDHLLKTPASIKFVSFEPLLGSISRTNFTGLNWIIVGGESGHKSRPMLEEWALQIRNNCSILGIPFFFKQWGGLNKKKKGRFLQGVIYNDMPRLT